MPVHQLPQAKHSFDVKRRYVRFRGLRENGYVEFDFSIGDPSLSVALTLPLAHYQEFCRKHEVIYLTREEGAALDHDQLKWRFGSPGEDEWQTRHTLQGFIDAD